MIKALHILRSKPFIFGLITFVLLLVLTQTLTYQQYRIEKEKEHEALLREINIVKTRFLNLLYNDITAANTLAIIAKQYSAENFDSIAKQILARAKYAEAIQLTWEGVIKNVYPLKGYENTIGINTNKDSLRRTEEKRALEKGNIFFAGPRKLRQGGVGILGKVPILTDGKLKGVVVILTKIDAIKKALYIEDANGDFTYMLNKNSGADTTSYQLSEMPFLAGTEMASASITEGDWTLKVGYSTLHDPAAFPLALSLSGVLVAILGSFITYRKAKEPFLLNKIIESKTKELSGSELKFRSLVEKSLVGVYIAHDGKFEYVNPKFEEILEYGKGELTGMDYLKIVHPDDIAPVKEKVKLMEQEKDDSVHYEIRCITKTGRTIHAELFGSSTSYNERPALIGTMLDITEQYHAEEKLKNSYEDIRRLNQHLNTVREEERAFIAREIHDELGQQLTGLKMDVSWIAKKMPEHNDFLKHKTTEIISALDNTIITVRKIASDLRPGILDDWGLVAALEWQTTEFENRSGIACNFVSDFKLAEPDKTITTTVFRIYQESLTNVMRHSGATEVNATLSNDEKKIILTVKDNGKGFDVNDDKKGKTLGLFGMNERAVMFGGNLEITSIFGKGTNVRLTIPLTS